jgi:hypothetical protein
MSPSRNRQKLVFLFVLLILGLSYPILSIFNRPVLLIQVPVLFIYLFALWILAILVLYVTVDFRKEEE